MQSENQPNKKIESLQILEQNIQQYSTQKQQFQMQLVEVESALSEISNSKKETFKIIGNIMVSSNQEDLKKELLSKQEMLKLRIESFEKHEEKLRKQAKDLQQEILVSMNNKEGAGDGKSRN
ncbi:MAG: prefoldin subunit [Nanoarchaeota archaeon]